MLSFLKRVFMFLFYKVLLFTTSSNKKTCSCEIEDFVEALVLFMEGVLLILATWASLTEWLKIVWEKSRKILGTVYGGVTLNL